MKKTIQEAFTAQVKTCPNKIALMHGEHSISYKELNERSNQVANHLKQLGLEKNSVIGVCLDRGFDLIVSIIGVLKAGHTYLPLDPSYPVSRLRYMHEHSQASAILCDPNNLNLFPNTDNLIDVTKINTSKEDYVVAGDNVYVIYTSGSTGVPKGVLLGQACLSNLLNWQSRNVANGTTLQFAPVSFDVHFQEIFGTLLSGHTLYLVSEKQRKNLLDMLKAIEANDIKRVFLPFVALEQICKLAKSNDLYPTCLEEVVTAGEQLRVNDNIREFFKETKARLHNHYGPSETHVCVAKTLSADVSSWPSLPAIGVSIDGAKTLVLDQDMNQVPEGELYVGGSSVAEGYIHDESRTSERFIEINNEKYYKTGDLVRTNMEGELEFVARIDGQVKISGHRIELGEIENCAQQAFPSADICSTVKTLENGEKVICVYVCGEHCEKTLKEHLRESLPDYMLPRFVVAVDSLPLTP
ncbi:MAG: amino acid adenylation domain-containing protein, partial [Bacteriovoracaceae bacterium]|nr:amino acid adenylation domain-containing protein [Bacteriovoracaceae bacterium]